MGFNLSEILPKVWHTVGSDAVGKDECTAILILQIVADCTHLVAVRMDTSHGNFLFLNYGISVQSARQLPVAKNHGFN